MSGVAEGGLRLTTGVAHPGPSIIPSPCDTQSPTPRYKHTRMLHKYLAGVELQPS